MQFMLDSAKHLRKRIKLNNMNLYRPNIFVIFLIFLVPNLFLICRSVYAEETIIRIVGDNAQKAPNSNPSSSPVTPLSTTKQSTRIRIIGDKSGSDQMRANEPVPQKKLDQPSPPQEFGITNNKSEPVSIKPDEKQVAVVNSNEGKFNENDVNSNEIQLAQRMIAIKAEEERKKAEKLELDRLAKIQAEKEAAEALKTAIKIEQQRAIIETERQLALQKEEKRIKDLKAEEERIAAERFAKLNAEKNLEIIKRSENRKEPEKAVAFSEKQITKVKEIENIIAYKTVDEQPSIVHRFHADPPSPMNLTSPRQNSHESPVSISNQINTLELFEQPPHSIWELYLSAKAIDPSLGRSESRVTGSKADSDVLFAGLLPHVDSSAGVKQISQTLTNYTTNDVNNDFTSLNYNLTARMTLLHMPTIYNLSASVAGLKVEQAGVAAAKQNLIVKFTDAYFSVLKAQTDKFIALGEINRLKQVLEQSQAFLKAGTGDIIAVYEAQSRLDGASADLTKSESNLRLAEQKLSTVVGKPVTKIMNYFPVQPLGPNPESLDWWVATMEKEQPLVRQAREGLTQISEQRKAVKAEYLPVIQASGGYDVNRGTAALPTAEVRQWFVGANLTLPLYSGGETAAKVRRATASEEERQHVFDETMDQQRENVKQAFYNLRYNISYIKALEQKKTSAEIQLNAVAKGRNIGTRNAIDVLNAEQAYSVALRDYKYALYDNILKNIQLKSAAGILAETDVYEISKTVTAL